MRYARPIFKKRIWPVCNSLYPVFLPIDKALQISSILDPRLTEEEVSEFHHALDAYGINMEKSSLYAVPTSTCNLLLSKDQCQPYYPNGRQCWDMKRRDFVTGKESVP